MTFKDFVEVYAGKVEPRISEHAWITKGHIIADETTSSFDRMHMNEIEPIDIARWQNELISHGDKNGKPCLPA